MAQVRVVSRKVYDQLVELLASDHARGYRVGSVVVMPRDLALVKGYRDMDEVEYNFGAEADVWLDLVGNGNHYFFQDHEDEEDEDD